MQIGAKQISISFIQNYFYQRGLFNYFRQKLYV